jgi:cytidyltransferase-like protein
MYMGGSRLSRVALTHGVFDLLHAGHMEHLRQASMFADRLIVSVLADAAVGKLFVINNEQTRMYQVSRIKGVDDVILCRAAGPWELLRSIRPDVYVRKDEYQTRVQPEYVDANELGIECAFTTTAYPHAKEIIQRIWDLKGTYDSR